MIATLGTDRLVLRPFRTDDMDALVALQAKESFWWYPLRRGMTDEETADFLARVISLHDNPDRPVFHAVVERATGALIGWAGLSVPDFLPELLPAVEVGWRLGVGHRGKGYATEAAAEALRWGFEDLGLGEIVAIYEPENVASGRVMDRLGFAAGSATVDPKRDLPLLVRTLSADEWRAGSR
jgi:RimJ/RimL family protein N-acetyltransferase